MNLLFELVILSGVIVNLLTFFYLFTPQTLEDNSLLNISSDSDMVRFLFYKQDTGVNISTLMSVAQPNWYISTAEQNNKPVEMCQETAKRFRSFNIGDIQGNVDRQS